MLRRPSLIVLWAGVHLIRRDQSLLAGSREVHSNPRPARAAELPPRCVKAGRFPEIGRLGDLYPVRKAQRLGPRPGKTEADLPAGLEVEGVIVERALLAAGDELRHGRKLAFSHRGLQVRARRPVAGPASLPQLRQQKVALAAEGREVRL